MKVISTSDQYGNPHCPIDHEPVEREGQFCRPACWHHFHVFAHTMHELFDMTYLDIEEQPWYGESR